MKGRPATFCLAVLLIPLLAAAKPAAYSLPDEKAVTLPPGPGAELATAQCSACHSLDYLQTQPRAKGVQFWRDTVTKMVKVHGAQISPDDAAIIADYLGATYGSVPK